MQDIKKRAIVIHGLGRTSMAMRSLARLLSQQGYVVTNLDYPSTRLPIAELVERYVAPAFADASDVARIDVVTHSLGGILFRYYWAHQATPEIRELIDKVVMLAPPNQGSEIPDQLRRWRLAKWILGPVMPELGTDSESIPSQLARQESEGFSCDIGVVAGTRSYEPWFSPWMPGENDGKVTVASTRLKGMKDFCTIKAGHTFIMDDKQVHRQILHFLGSGTFSAG